MIKDFSDLHLTGNIIIDSEIIFSLKEKINEEDILILSGDIFDSFDISTRENLFYEFLSELKNEIFILLGNHDFSRGRCWINSMKYLKKNIHIIQDYEYFDSILEGYRFHFFNYFRNNVYITFNINHNKKNILFSHCDINNIDEIPEEFKCFDRVYNGHIHFSSEFENVVNIGSFRTCKINEQKICRYLIINGEDFEEVKFESPIDIKELFVGQLNDFNPDKVTILTVLLGGLTNVKEVENNIKALPWYDEGGVVLKPFKRYLDENVLNTVLETVKTENGFDILGLFEQYINIYAEKFGNDFDKEKVKLIFKDSFKNKYEKIEKLFSVFNLEFNSIECQNFKLFTDLKLSLDKFNNGIISITGKNYDELKETDSSSNESGKSCLRQILEFLLLGNFNPLRWNTKSGFAKIDFNINSDNIIIEKTFIKSGVKSCSFIINGKEEWANETNSNKVTMFFEKYNFQNAIQFFLISDAGLARHFFSSKNSEKFKIFRTIFPIIQNLFEFISEVQDEKNTLEEEFEVLKNEVENLKDKRKETLNHFLTRRKLIKNEYKDLKIDDIENKLNKIIIDDELINNKFNIQKISKELEDENILNVYENYEKDINELLDNKEKFDKINNEILQQNIFIENEEKNIDRIKNEIKKNEVDCNLISNKLEKINGGLNKDQLIELKNIIIIFKIFEELNISKDELNNLNNYDFDLLNREKITKDKIQKRLIELKNRIEKLTIDKKDAEDNFIECPECKFKIKNVDLIESIENQINESISEGSKLKIEYDKITSEINIIEKKSIENKKLLENLNNELKKYKLNLFYFCSIINNEEENKKRIENYSTNYIEKLIKEKEEEIFLNRELLSLNKKIKELKDYLIKHENNIKKIKDNFIFLKEKLSAINFDSEKYQDFEKILDKLQMTKNQYLMYKNKIDDILELNIIKTLDKKNIKYIESLFKKLKDEEEKSSERKELLINLKYEKEKENNLKQEKKELLSILEKENKLYSIRKKIVEYNEKENKYNDVKLLYEIMTNKRTFNFEKFFITVFFDKLKSIFNVFLKYVFSRDIELNIDENNFNFKDSGNVLEFNDFSNGAKSKIEACLLLVINVMFSNYGINSNLLLIDEFLDRGLDQINMYRVLTLIKQFFSNKKCFLISHKNISDFIDQNLTVERRDGESYIFI